MRRIHALVLMIGTMLLTVNCNSSKSFSPGKKSKQAKKASAETPKDPEPTASSTAGDKAAEEKAASGASNVLLEKISKMDNTAATYYLGFDGKTDFSIYVGFDAGEADAEKADIQDPTVAKLIKEDFVVTPPMLEAIITERKAQEEKAGQPLSKADEDETRKFFAGKTIKLSKLVPLKAGKTKITYSFKDEAGKDVQGSAGIIIYPYTPELVELGKTRYATAADGAKRPCASCHLTGKLDAPTHKVGNVQTLSEKRIANWIVASVSPYNPDGQTGEEAYQPKFVEHKWAFDGEKQLQGTLAFLRSIQARDPADIAKYVLANFF